MRLVDSHCHIDGEEFGSDISDVLSRAKESGVVAMLCVGTGDVMAGQVAKAVVLAEKNERVFAAVGVHPHDASSYDDDVEDRLVELASSPKVVGYGEIGLDYYYEHSPRDRQVEVFERQLDVAARLDLPVIIHTRDAEADTINTMMRAGGSVSRGGVMHCFGGSLDGAEAFLDLGFHISFAGNVTFKKAEELRRVATYVPLDRILVETDCPYMSPEPVRGGRNEPGRVVHTAKVIADLKGIPLEEFAESTTRNFERLFGLSV